MEKGSQELKTENITKEEYDLWRYNYPRIEAKRTRANLDALRENDKKTRMVINHECIKVVFK